MHVDDDSDTRKAVRTLLQTEGYNVVSAMSAEICLNKLKEVKPDIMLVDIMMPRISGWDLFNKIRKRGVSSKVIFLSVLPVAKQKKKEMCKLGVSDYIMKPFLPEELLGALEKLKPRPRAKDHELSVHSFIKRMKSKEKIKLLSEAMTNLLVLQVIKKKEQRYCQEIIEEVLSELQALACSDLTDSSLFRNKHFMEKSPKHKNLDNQIKKELISQFYIFVGSNALYPLLSCWERAGIVAGELMNRRKVYTLTEKGERGIKVLSDYFVKVLHENEGESW